MRSGWRDFRPISFGVSPFRNVFQFLYFLVITLMYWVVPLMFWVITLMYWVITLMCRVITLIFWVITLIFWAITLIFWVITLIFWVIALMLWVSPPGVGSPIPAARAVPHHTPIPHVLGSGRHLRPLR